MIDVSELIRIFGSNIKLDNSDCIDNTFQDTVEQGNNTASDKIISMLEQQLKESKELLKEAKEREDWLKSQLDKTTLLLEDKTTKKRKKFLGIF